MTNVKPYSILSCIITMSLSLLSWSACKKAENSTPGLVIEYLRSTSDQPLTKEQALVVVLQDGICGACTTETLEFLERSLGQTNCKVQVLLARPNPQIEQRLRKGLFPPKIVIGDLFKMERYGLRTAEDALYIVAGDSLLAWSKLSDQHLPAARKLLSKYACTSPLVEQSRR